TLSAPTVPKRPSSISPSAALCAGAREDLGLYGLLVHGYRPAAVHDAWIDHVVETVSGRGAKRKLLLVAPPGHAKSTWISQVFPAWYLGRHPDQALLFASSS